MFCKIYGSTIFIRAIDRAIEKLQNEYKINFIKVAKRSFELIQLYDWWVVINGYSRHLSNVSGERLIRKFWNFQDR